MTDTIFYFFLGPVISTPPFVVYGMEQRRRDLKWHGPCGSHVQETGCRAQLFLGLRRGPTRASVPSSRRHRSLFMAWSTGGEISSGTARAAATCKRPGVGHSCSLPSQGPTRASVPSSRRHRSLFMAWSTGGEISSGMSVRQPRARDRV